jgi:threonyl-tRNA synthetase
MLQQDYLSHLAQKGCSCAELANMMERGEIEGYLLKPMNCPHHIRLFASQRYSYRNLPIRFAEFGTVYRWEQSGEVGGLTRVRGFTQDDAHLFCTEEQVPNEIKGCLKLVNIIFGTLQMKDYRVRVGLRDPDSSKYVGSAEMWDRAERACRESAADLGVPFTEEAGEAAFYGPKIDFIVRDILGREWQLGTVQVDYNLPERFDLKYIGADNNTHRPVMIHRAPFGSLERFIGVLIEHFAGVFPTWLAPEQVRILPLSEKSNDYATKVLTQLQAIGVRATSDYSSEHIKNKILVASDEKIPYLLVVGPRDAENHAVSVRIHGIRENLGAIPTETFITALQQEIQSRSPNSKIRSLFDR